MTRCTQVRNKELHGDALKALGADEVLSTADDDVPARVKELTGTLATLCAVHRPLASTAFHGCQQK